MVGPPEGKRRGLRRFVGRRKAEAAAAIDVVDEPPVDETIAEAAEPAPEPADPQTPDPAAELDARFDAARERLRAQIAPPDPED